MVKFFVTKAARPQLVNSLGGRRSGEGNLSPPNPQGLNGMGMACMCVFLLFSEFMEKFFAVVW